MPRKPKTPEPEVTMYPKDFGASKEPLFSKRTELELLLETQVAHPQVRETLRKAFKIAIEIAKAESRGSR